MIRRAFTLLELTIVVALVMLIAGLVIPTSVSLIAPSRQREAVAAVEGVISIARAQAQATGRLRRVVIEETPDGDAQLRIDKPADASDEDGPGAFSANDDDDSFEPTGYVAPLAGARLGLESEEGDDRASGELPDRELLIATIAPDGSIIPGVGLVVTDSQDRSWRLTIGAWTGVVTPEPISESEPGDETTADDWPAPPDGPDPPEDLP